MSFFRTHSNVAIQEEYFLESSLLDIVLHQPCTKCGLYICIILKPKFCYRVLVECRQTYWRLSLVSGEERILR